MKSHPIKLGLFIEVFDKNGKSIKKTYTENESECRDNIELIKFDNNNIEIEKKIIPMRSFVYNFLRYLNGIFTYYKSFQFRNLINSNISSTEGTGRASINANLNEEIFGIKIGTGSSDVSASNYNLDYPLPNSMVLHSGTTFDTASSYGDGYKASISRMFTNSTENNLNIKELGIILKQDASNGYYPYKEYTLLLRDTISSGSLPIDFILSSSQNVNIKYNWFIDGTSGLTKNFLHMLHGTLCESGYNTYLKNVYYDGITVLENNYIFNQGLQLKFFTTNAPAGNSTYGIVVGGGTSSISVENYKLDSKYENGTATNQLNYGIMYYSSSYDNISGSSMAIQTRIFVNNSGNPITIREAGIYSWGTGSTNANQPTGSTSSPFLCIARKLTGDVTLEHEQSVNISFVFNTQS